MKDMKNLVKFLHIFGLKSKKKCKRHSVNIHNICNIKDILSVDLRFKTGP